MGGIMNMQGGGIGGPVSGASGGTGPPVSYTAANAPPDPTTVPIPTARPQIDATSVDENKPDAKTVDASNLDEDERDLKTGLPIRRKKGN
jgi:hypothetical protein